MGSIRDAKGYIAGNVKIGGTAGSPDIDGRLNFNQTSFVVAMLNNEFKIDNSAIVATTKLVWLKLSLPSISGDPAVPPIFTLPAM